MLQKRSKICDEVKKVEKPRIIKTESTTTSRPKFNDEQKNSSACDCNSVDIQCDCPSKSNTPNNTLHQASVVSDEIERNNSYFFHIHLFCLESRSGENGWSLWIVIGILIFLVQTTALIILYCKYLSKRRKAKKASVTLKMPKTSVKSVINAYCPTLIDGTLPSLKNGTLPYNGTIRRGPMGDVSIQLNGSSPNIY